MNDLRQEYVQWLDRLSSDLRSQGYASVLNKEFVEQDATIVINRLLPEFAYLMYIEVESYKKYFIADYSGRNTVVKLIDRSIDHKKTARIRALENSRLTDHLTFEEEINRLKSLQHLLEQSDFE
ncbi:hypothetical protein PO903_13930 [Paenibacillus sp. PK4536]|uniref:hypothetical protein n=1 Tax=Paenibacillus sp. PK4536 TaxID=3024576 RepID=UPI002359C806|nr:hypothetical protein [Paenibacillus sp. PK4536]WIM37748.1 hypothetical protein PO903_13930 [Paenibacillus sp. PK4536]